MKYAWKVPFLNEPEATLMHDRVQEWGWCIIGERRDANLLGRNVCELTIRPADAPRPVLRAQSGHTLTFDDDENTIVVELIYGEHCA